MVIRVRLLCEVFLLVWQGLAAGGVGLLGLLGVVDVVRLLRCVRLSGAGVVRCVLVRLISRGDVVVLRLRFADVVMFKVRVVVSAVGKHLIIVRVRKVVGGQGRKIVVLAFTGIA